MNPVDRHARANARPVAANRRPERARGGTVLRGGTTSADSPSTTLGTARGKPLSASTARYAAGIVVIAAASFALAQGGKALLLTGPAGAFWPAGGLGIAVLYLGGLRWWPGVLLGDLGSLLWDVQSTDLAVPVGSALAEAAGDMARALVAVFVLQWLAGPRAAMDRLRDVGAVLVGVASGAAISATVAMLALRAGNVIADMHLTEFWRSWWLGDVSGGLVVIPLALAWTRRPTQAWRGRGWEGALMIAAVVALSAIAMSADQPLTYIVFPAFIWAALRLGPHGATLAVAVAVVIAVWATSNELGPFVEHLPTDSALNLQLYITFASLMTLCLAAIVRERRRVALELVESHARVAAAGAEERHRLERELHDSAQNRLIALQVHLSLARERSAETSPELAATLDRLLDDAVAVGDELRRIGQGISPPVLATMGLAAALTAEAAHSAISVRVSADDVGFSESEVELAVYLSCLELMQNAAKHAGPDASLTIRLRRDADGLAFSVVDDGRGFDQRETTWGVGLAGVHDRIYSVGGHLEIVTEPGVGTTATGIVPWPPHAG
jgi:signal transduction histidine kinase